MYKTKKTTVQSTVAFTNAMNMAQQIIQNYKEDFGFVDILDRFENKEFTAPGPIVVGKTPNVLALGGATLGLDVVINKNTIIKCMSKPDQWHHGHDLERDILKYLIFELRNPVMLLKGSKENTLVAVTDLRDKNNNPVIVSLALNRECEHHLINQITSAYGKRGFDYYIANQFKAGNVIAINKNKANLMLQSLAPNCAIEETPISFDNSIAYTFENVNGFIKEKPKKFSFFFHKKENPAKDFEKALRGIVDNFNNIIKKDKDVIEKLQFFDYAGEEIYNSLLWHQFQLDKEHIKNEGVVSRLHSLVSDAETTAKNLNQNKYSDLGFNVKQAPSNEKTNC